MRRRVRTTLSFAALLLATALGYAPPASAQATPQSPIREQDQDNYDTLFQEKLTSVKRTRTVSDDKTLAEEMMALAKGVPDDPGVQCLIYIEVITLASSTSDLQQMYEAYGLLDALWPGQDAVSPEELMQLASRAYRGVERADREVQGEHYIRLLRDVAADYEAQNDPEQAISVCRLAATVARTLGSEQLEPINAKIEMLADAQALAERIEQLKLSLQRSPQNAPAALDLVELLVVRMDDPVQAAQFVGATQDEELVDLVTRSAMGIEQANAATAMRVADWYLSLAEDRPDEQALDLVRQARRWYARFFAQYSRDDALAKRVAEMDRLAQDMIAKLGGDGADADGWISLIASPFDPNAHKTNDVNIERDELGGLTIKADGFFVPFQDANAYEIRFTLTVKAVADDNNRPALRLHLPLKDRVLSTSYFLNRQEIATIDHVSETRLIKPAPGRVGKKCELTFQVVMDEGREQVAFAMLYNGTPGVKWQDQLNKLKQFNKERLEQLQIEIDHAMFLECPAHVTLHAVDYRVRG